MRLSHRLRLTLSATIVAAVVLGAIFFSVFFFANELEKNETRSILRSAALQTFSSLGAAQVITMRDIVAADPTLSIAVFDDKGRLQTLEGKLTPIARTEFISTTNQGNEVVQLGVESANRRVVVVMDWDSRAAALHRLAEILVLLYLPLVGLVGGTTWLAARATFRPLESLTRQAAELGGTDVGRRLAVQDDAEFGSFAEQLNSMLDRLEAMVRRQEQFAADAAHELRTPLTIVRGKIETTLLRKREQGDYEKTLNAVLAEMERLSGLVEGLLQSARSVSEPAPPMNLRPAVELVTQRWKDPFRERNVRLSLEAEDAVACMKEDEIACILDNLLGNALRHSPSKSECRVRLYRASERAVLEVTDQGPGVSKELEGKVFERFVRGEPSRNRMKGGFGIGLSICKQILQSRHGYIEVENNLEGGATFRATVVEASMSL